MGCDIHLYVERRVNGVWESADKWTNDSELYGDSDYEYVAEWDCYYKRRNYDLFAVLANVRNDSSIVPISDPRGIPADATERLHLIGAEGDYHSHSWFTLAELFEYDWLVKVSRSARLSASEFAYWLWTANKVDAPPVISYTSISPNEVIYVSEAEMTGLLKPIKPSNAPYMTYLQINEKVAPLFPKHRVECEWQQPLSTLVWDFWVLTMPRLLHLGKPDDVRIVFWFDN